MFWVWAFTEFLNKALKLGRSDGLTPLHCAARRSSVEAARQGGPHLPYLYTNIYVYIYIYKERERERARARARAREREREREIEIETDPNICH